MARAKQQLKAKEPVTIRFKKLANGNKSIYLDMYNPDGDKNHLHTYEFLKLYLIPETDKAAKIQNQNTLQAANAIKAQRLLEYANGKAGIKQSTARGKMLLLDWMQHFKELKEKQGQSKSNAVNVNNLMLHLKAYRGDKVTMNQVSKAYCEGFIMYLSTAMSFPRNRRARKPVVHKEPKPLSQATITDYYNTFVYVLNEAKRLNMPKSVLLADCIEQVIMDKEEQGTSKTRLASFRRVQERLQMYTGDTARLKDATKPFCQGFFSYLCTATCTPTRTKEKQYKDFVATPLSKTTATLYYNTFVCALNEAVKADVIDSNPTAKISKEAKKPIKAEGSTRTYLTLDELKALMAAPCPNETVKKAFFFACFCGLRISDIVKLTWAEIRQEGQQVLVDTRMKKTGKAILLPLSQQACMFLPECRDAKGLVFAALPKQTTINDDIKAWAQRAQITKDMVFHTSRHTFATTALTLGADIYTTSKLLGHQNLRTTQIYAEIVNQKKTEAVNLFNGLLDNK